MSSNIQAVAFQPDGCKLSALLTPRVCHVCQYCQVSCPEGYVQCTFASDRSLSKHLHTQMKGGNYTILSICRGLCNRHSGYHTGFVCREFPSSRPEFDVKSPLGALLMIFPRGYLLKSFSLVDTSARQWGFEI